MYDEGISPEMKHKRELRINDTTNANYVAQVHDL